MKKILIATVFVLALALSACGGSDSSTPTPAEVPAENSTEAATVIETAAEEVVEEEANGMDLSIYPSSNIAAFEASAGAKPTYDELYARIEPFVAEIDDPKDGTNTYYRDANGEILLSIQYDNGEVSVVRFEEHYEDGTRKGEYYTDGLGDSVAYQFQEYDVNGQRTREAYRSSRKDIEFTRNTVYDYHANGNIARENGYEDTVLTSAITYNENGSPLSWVYYENGAEKHRTDYTYDADGKLLKKEDYYEGKLSYWYTYEYDTNGRNSRINEYSPQIGADVPAGYTVLECFDNGDISHETFYRLDEGLFLGYSGGEPRTEYFLYREVEYYENGNFKSEFYNDYVYMENGEIADMYLIEYNKDGLRIAITYYNYLGNEIGKVTY